MAKEVLTNKFHDSDDNNINKMFFFTTNHLDYFLFSQFEKSLEHSTFE